VIVDSESYISAMFKVIENLGLEILPHPHPNKVSWINSTTIGVTTT